MNPSAIAADNANPNSVMSKITAENNADAKARLGKFVSNQLGIPTSLFDVGFWRRVGVGALGVAIMLTGLIILLRRPLGTAATLATKIPV
jgi:hypothetical protein